MAPHVVAAITMSDRYFAIFFPYVRIILHGWMLTIPATHVYAVTAFERPQTGLHESGLRCAHLGVISH